MFAAPVLCSLPWACSSIWPSPCPVAAFLCGACVSSTRQQRGRRGRIGGMHKKQNRWHKEVLRAPRTWCRKHAQAVYLSPTALQACMIVSQRSCRISTRGLCVAGLCQCSLPCRLRTLLIFQEEGARSLTSSICATRQQHAAEASAQAAPGAQDRAAHL